MVRIQSVTGTEDLGLILNSPSSSAGLQFLHHLFQVKITNYSLQILSHTTDTHEKQTLWETISHISFLMANLLTKDI